MGGAEGEAATLSKAGRTQALEEGHTVQCQHDAPAQGHSV